MNSKRLLAGASVALTGLGILLPTVGVLAGGSVGLVGGIIAGFGTVLGIALLAGGGWLAQSDIDGNHALRVAGWNLLGIVALGSVLVLVSLFPGAMLPMFVLAVIMGVSAVAHVLIGINDVRRIRVTELATEREKLAVLNRLTRHNLRNDTQVLLSLADLLEARTDDGELASLAERLQNKSADIAGIGKNLTQFQRAIDHEPSQDRHLDLGPLVDGAVDDAQSAHPDASFDVEVPADAAVRADEHLAVAVEHLLDNAARYDESNRPEVSVTARENGGSTDLSVGDDGPGIPDTERAIITGEQEITQLEHGSGLGLWVVKAITESYGGSLSIETPESGGTNVTLSIPTA
ncbi:sensor histidine kinase [Halorientalis salina]|uniref:sensor histidine kinase n=1 Tax=Halorientalis salina TaxID=2932266 RepID=UPI00145FBC41|nr:HAMP domain-containing sensor histidine kinase [Halorientalis salina]